MNFTSHDTWERYLKSKRSQPAILSTPIDLTPADPDWTEAMAERFAK